MPSEGSEEPDGTEEGPQAPRIVHADGTLTLESGSIRVEVTKGRDYRGTIAVPLERCTLRVMGRAIAVSDGGRLVHLCSRCKPTAEVARLVAQVGDRATLEPRTPFATLLALREESAAYRPPGAATRDQKTPPPASVDADPALEVPSGHESLRRVYLSRAAMERTRAACGRRLGRASGLDERGPPGGRGCGAALRAAARTGAGGEPATGGHRGRDHLDPAGGDPPRSPPEG